MTYDTQMHNLPPPNFAFLWIYGGSREIINFLKIEFSHSFVTANGIHQELPPPIPPPNVRDKTNYGPITPQIDHSDGMALPADYKSKREESL